MKKLLLVSLICLLGPAVPGRAEKPPADVVKRLTNAIHEHCPDAVIETKDDEFIAKTGTMLFAIHSSLMTGEYTSSLMWIEGPNVRGFLLGVKWIKGDRWNPPQCPPGDYDGPYYRTLTRAPIIKGGSYQIRFSYGKNLDPKLKQAILDALPKNFWEQTAQPSPAKSSQK